MKSTRFGVRNENVSQAVEARQVKGAVTVKRNPLAEIRRRPLQPTAGAAAPAIKEKTSCQNAGESQCMDIDEEPQLQLLPLQIWSHDEALLAKYQELPDVDSAGSDWRDAQLVSCYVKEIFSYLHSLEPTQRVRRDYLCQPAKMEITPRMHRTLFDWLVQVHYRYGLLPETLYMTLHIIDYYMTLDGRDINKTNYQLLGITALFLSAKYEELYPPYLADLVALTEMTCSESQVRRMEQKILVRMEFFFGYPQPILFLRRYSRVSGATAEVHDSAKFLAELGRCTYEMVHLPPSCLAATAFCLAVELLNAGERLDTQPKAWLPELEVFSGYTKAELVPALRMLARTVLQSYSDKQKYTAVRKKYESRSFQMVSCYPEFNDQSNPVLLKYAANGSA